MLKLSAVVRLFCMGSVLFIQLFFCSSDITLVYHSIVRIIAG